jgi:hypothetical protein
MYQALSLICFVFIFWAILGMDFSDDGKGSKSSDNDSMLPAILGGILVSPLLALGGFLFVLGRIAIAIPAILYGILVLCGQALQWLWEQCQKLFGNLREVLGRLSRNVEKLLKKVGLRRTLDRVMSIFNAVMARVTAFLRQILDVVKRIFRNIKEMFAAIGRWFVQDTGSSESHERSSPGDRVKAFFVSPASSRRGRDSASGTENRRSSASSSLSGRSWWLIPLPHSSDRRFTQSVSGRKHRDAARHSSGGERSVGSSSWNGGSVSELLSRFFTRRSDDTERKSRDPVERREAATHRVHGTRFSRVADSVSFVFHGRVAEGKATFKRVERHEAFRNVDIMEDLRKIGRRTRTRIKSVGR